MPTRAETCCIQKRSKAPRWGSDLRKADKAAVTDHERQEVYEGEYNEGFIPYPMFYCGRKFQKI
jgi:hypothetical protein